MDRMRSFQQPRETIGVLGESEESIPFSRIPGPAAPPSPPPSPFSSSLPDPSPQSIRPRPQGTITNRNLREDLNKAISTLTDFLKNNAFRKYVFFEWQKKKKMSENDGETDEELVEHLKEVLKMIEVDYQLMRKENNQLKEYSKKQDHAVNTYQEKYETTDKGLYNSQRLVKQLEAKVKDLEGQAARGRENRAEKEQTAREEAAREQADREQQFAQLQHEKEELSEDLNQAKEERAVQTERTAQVQRELDLEQRARVQAEQEHAAEGQVQEQTRNELADAQAQNDTLTQENNALRAQFGELQNQQNEIQWRNETLEAQVGLLLANFVTNQLERNTLINRCNEIREQRNEALRQLDIMREGNEDVALVYEDTVKNHEEEICYLLYQMAEMHGAAWPETGPWRITETLGEESKKPFNQSSQPRSGPPLRWVRRGRKLHLESMTPDGQWQQTYASRYAQQFPNSWIGCIFRIVRSSRS